MYDEDQEFYDEDTFIDEDDGGFGYDEDGGNDNQDYDGSDGEGEEGAGEGEDEDDQPFTNTFADTERTGGGGMKRTRFEQIFQTREDSFSNKAYMTLKEEFHFEVKDIEKYIQDNIHPLTNYQHKNIYVLVAAITYRDKYGYKINSDHLNEILSGKIYREKNILPPDLIRYIRILQINSKGGIK